MANNKGPDGWKILTAACVPRPHPGVRLAKKKVSQLWVALLISNCLILLYSNVIMI